MSEYTVRGSFRMRERWQSFEKRVDAPNERVAEEYTLAAFGSQHNLKRTQVRIDEVEA